MSVHVTWLDIGGYSLDRKAFWVTDLSPLFSAANTKGGDRDIPHVDGAVPYRRRKAASVRMVTIQFDGKWTAAGGVNTDTHMGVLTSIAAVKTNVVASPGTSAGTRLATLHLPTGTLTADVHVISFEVQWIKGSKAEATMELSIPAGEFT